MLPTPEDITALAQAPQLLVAMDFDGTLAHFSVDPNACRAVPGALEAMQQLSEMPGTTAMVISGRNVELLSRATQLNPARAAQARTPGDGIIRLVGSHGAEPADRPVVQLSDPQRELLAELLRFAETQASRDEGIWVERKPFAVGLHTRAATDRRVAASAVAEFAAFADEHPGAKTTLGKDILEVAVTSATKGGYVSDYLAQAHPPVDKVIFAGDDTTDETVMSILSFDRGDVGVKVGDGETAGNRRVATPEDVRDLLQQLAEARSTATSSR